ncbi:hypothetical protein BN159_5993 [Streptomyces davaonensis JCM 4913]|uniref:Uncharacterized protein n=1 Tax=Streptomyces davaonensis (strain DSM 101723 / JCM 4913 / KCC S-0913 / 768) TaxID=1214101 RepID=K4RAW7_STRDJ|nr:hypothetical protein BN159_5993 [Streptomyces davaonensis JCM 4913]
MSTEARRKEAEQSAGRAGGYCWMEHPKGGRHCTRRPHSHPNHVDYYNGRKTVTDPRGTEWKE